MKDLFEADAAAPAPGAQSVPGTSAEYTTLVQLLAAIGVPLGKTRVLEAARLTGLRGAGGRSYNADMVTAELQQAMKCGWVKQVTAGYVCDTAHGQAAFRMAALTGQVKTWQPAIWKILQVPVNMASWDYTYLDGNALSIMRVAACSGFAGKALEALNGYLRHYDPTHLFFRAMCQPFDAALLELVDQAERDHFVERSLMWMFYTPNDSASQLVQWAWQRCTDADVAIGLRYRTCEHLLWQSRIDEALALIAGDESGNAIAMRAAAAVMRREPGALEHYACAFDGLRKLTSKKVDLLPISSAWLHAAALIVQNEPKALEQARRFCRAEARAMGRQHDWAWIRLQEVAEVRLGDREPESIHPALEHVHGLAGLIALETAAWLKKRASGAPLAHAKRCAQEFVRAGYTWAARECEAAIAILGGHTPGAEFAGTLATAFANEQTWRRALAAINALSDAKRVDAEDTRLVWIISMTRDTVDNIDAWEQKRGPRGWNKGKRATYARLSKTDTLTPRDAQVCGALDRISSVSYHVDTGRALSALVGHPLVFFDDDLATPVELILSDPELTVTRSKQGLRVSLNPDLRAVFARRDYNPFVHIDESRKTERTLLVRDTPTRARVVRLTAAHKRVAELVGESLLVPDEGAEELSRAIESAARFFQVHSAVASALPEVAADASLRAELAPAGDGLRLRLAVQPFSNAGPRYAPGVGGARVIAEVAGERRAALRDLRAEQASATGVLDALPMLDSDTQDFEWHIDEPQDCLQLVETLQGMEQQDGAVRIEWPSGVKFKVTRAYGAADFKLNCSSSGGWFVASGGLQLDEGTVVDMARLIEFARQSGGRFVPLGEGGFVALTEDLRRRIDEFASLVEPSPDGLRVHALAAGAMEEIAEGTNWTSDKAWAARMKKVREAETLEPEVPSTLAAELREYQFEGYQWLARLAHWGAGACLADDMGLGKTVQTLALLLRRAPDGAALVVAPTSVCALWVDEARRFAPTLNVQTFGATGERAAQIAEAGAFTLLVCSYTLMQQEIELFAAREWHTVVLDEAQAVKNFATKRAQAVFSLKAGFRIATTGTPVENRLDELWTLFRFLNPGLLGSRERFNERYAAPIERSRDGKARQRLRRLTRPFVMRRLKSEVLTELPPRTEIIIRVEPEAQERAFYEALRRDALTTIEGGAQPLAQRRFQVLAQLMRLRRACCDPRLAVPDAAITGAKLEAFAGIVEELVANKHKALVFSQFVDYLHLLRGELDRMKVPYQYLDGSTPAPERARAVAAFQKGEGEIFLISLRAGGFGLNLTAADYVIIADPWWNPAVEDQAAARAHRMGQERPVTVYRLVIKGSVEERIMAMHKDKRALAEALFEGEAFGAAVSVDELVRLMREEA